MIVDARGLSCPQPVVEAKKAVAAGEATVEILLDNATSIANVTRFMTSRGYRCKNSEARADGSTKLVFGK